MGISRDAIENALLDADIPVDEARWDYNSRGMYGGTCFGFVVVGNPLAALGRFLIEFVLLTDDRDAAEALASAATTDSMGKGTIVYFPSITITYAEDDA